jgi:hypothetical protein
MPAMRRYTMSFGTAGLTAKQAAHRPGTAPALGLRAETAAHILD